MKAKTLYRVFLRSGPRRVLCHPRMLIAAGAEVEVLELEGEWVRVRCAGKEGFLGRDALELEPGGDDDFFELPEMLIEELAEIGKGRGGRGWEREPPQHGEEKEARLLRVFPRLHDARLAALCLSGGGIRSATFNLGVLQGLARCGVLGEMDYLSTVSGGGYIGSWLTSWISAQDGDPRQRVARVVEELAQDTPQARRREPYQVRFLRDYSNYLTPRVGVLSVDTWSIIGTYLRNLLLNWLILIPLFLTFLLLPRFMVLLTGGGWADPGGHGLLWLAALFGIIPIAYTVIDLPSIGDGKLERGDFVLFFLTPLLLMACFLSAYWGNGYLGGAAAYPSALDFAWYAARVHLVGWGMGMAWLWARKEVSMPPVTRIAAFCACAAATGGLAGMLGWVAAVKLLPLLPSVVEHRKIAYAVVAVPLVLADYLLTGTVLVALLSRCTGDQDREWWGRAGGVTIMAALLWSLLMAAVVYGPWLMLPEATPFWTRGYTFVGGGAGIAAALMGKNRATPALRPGASMDRLRTQLPAVAAALFLLFLLQGVSLLTTCILRWVESPSAASLPVDLATHLRLLLDTPALLLTHLALLSSLLWFAMALLVNINTFSMHAMYRNRLVRCYLGASRGRLVRCPNPFTGFDRRDDRAFAGVATRPFHVVNMAWNLVKGKRLAWQQRKAASFIMSPLFAGSDLVADDGAKSVKPGGYRRMCAYGAGWIARTASPVTLGTAMAISGAAASPNMGYHSSTLVAFVMAFFNVRLGWWLGNPGVGMRGAWRKASPGLALLPLVKETLGLTREDSRDVYLSDGGHFENLALYEMVRRRCRYLIVCDAGCDRDGRFEDLGNAVRKVRADFGIEIEIDLTGMRAKKLHFAVGTVRYSCCDAGEEDGALLYLKPALTGDEPADLLNYSKVHPEFPHEPTSDQWFDEAQFESYRRLGLHAVNRVSLGDQLDLEHLFARAARQHRHALREVGKSQSPAR